jgi:glutamyl-tRNA synthetase
MNDSNTPVVRFAPSPTGHLHIGGVRTALFNYLYAKNLKGKFILRIEDTDLSRSSQEMAEEIIEGLKWLGFHWDEGPYYQSSRFELYRKAAFRLLEKNLAYRCFCSPEQLNERRNQSQNEPVDNSGDKSVYPETNNRNDKSQFLYKYDRKCLNLSKEQIAKNLSENIPYVIRFLIPEGFTYFKDRIHKEMKTDNNELEDFVLLKSDNSPTYHLSVVVDDSEMGIDNVIRGDDHISNTFKQVLLFKALDRKPPKYAHLPLILGADKKKLSKRHGETSILEFKRAGYLPEALINYLSQLSWIPADTKTIFTLEELTQKFSLSKLSKNSPVFDYEKLKFINSLAIQQKQPAEIYRILIADSQFTENLKHLPEERILATIDLIKPRMKTIDQFREKVLLYTSERLEYNDNTDEFKNLCLSYPPEVMSAHLKQLYSYLENVEIFNSENVENILRKCAEDNELKAADLIHPARFALTSERVSPSLFQVFKFYGKHDSLKRLSSFLEWLKTLNKKY